MNPKHVFGLFIITFCFVFLAACGDKAEESESESNEKNDQEELKIEETNESKEKEEAEAEQEERTELSLTQLLPYKRGYTWTYNGSVEYGHSMHLESIDEKIDKTIYKLKGEVDDVSGGESKKDFSLEVTYTVTSDSIVQSVKSETMMDNHFEQIELIKTPLEIGAAWTQKQINAEGEEVTIDSSIEAIREDGEQKIYTVTYEDQASDYYQKRDIKEGVGVLSFEHLYFFGDDEKAESMPLSYEIYYEKTGFDVGERQP